ncbi:MAG TPA: outer membrane beta-barrel protein [Polyangia bacterium]|nr:outer membrane beta-barrel protein [Polyangia bacterium]
MKRHRCVRLGALAVAMGALPASVLAAPPAPATTGRVAQRWAPTNAAPVPTPTPVAPPRALALAADENDTIEPSDATPATFNDLADRMRDTEARLEQLRGVVLGRQPRVTVGGYVDFGFFAAQGNGSGIIRDDGNALFPQYKGQYGWVFLGDLLAPTVNSRGEAADLGDAAGVQRFDGIHSGGAPGFIVNEVNLLLTSSLGEGLLATGSVNFVPRTGSNFSLGDFLDVDVAQLEWMPTRSQKTSIFVGKFDSVLGIEYRERKASQRFGITPSLIARYTTGTALGLKVRSKWGPDDLVVLAAAVTNGSNTTEQFHFYNEIDTNAAKTASGRLSLHPPLPLDVELGVSGSYGAQDRAPDSKGAMWFWGVDLQAHILTVDVKAMYLRGAAPGSKMGGSADVDLYGLKLHNGGYAEVDWMITPLFGLMGRGELRDAMVWQGDPATAVQGAAQGANRLYLTKSWRATGGVRVAFSDRIILKAEYLRNGEYGGIPQIKNDVVTTSLVLIN